MRLRSQAHPALPAEKFHRSLEAWYTHTMASSTGRDASAHLAGRGEALQLLAAKEGGAALHRRRLAAGAPRADLLRCNKIDQPRDQCRASMRCKGRGSPEATWELQWPSIKEEMGGSSRRGGEGLTMRAGATRRVATPICVAAVNVSLKQHYTATLPS